MTHKTKLSLALAALFGVSGAACVQDQDIAIGSDQKEILGDLDIGDSCSAPIGDFLRTSMFVTRVVVASDAFEECVRQAVVVTGQYIQCTPPRGSGDPNVSRSRHFANAMQATRSVNNVKIRCDFNGTAWGRAGVGSTPAYYGRENFKVEGATQQAFQELGRRLCAAGETPAVNNCKSKPFPYPYTEIGATIVHENMHQHGYTHDVDRNDDRDVTDAGDTNCSTLATWSDFTNSMPWIVDQCLIQVINQSQATCGDICPTRSGDDLSSCVDRGRLTLVDELDSATCRTHQDPGQFGMGFLQEDSDGEFRSKDLFAYGKRHGGSWLLGEANEIAGQGKFALGRSGAQYIVRSGWGMAVTDWTSLAGGALSDIAIAAHGTSFAHEGNGYGTWRLQSGDAVVGVGRYTDGIAGLGRVTDEVLIKSATHIGVLLVGNGYRTRSRWSLPTTIWGSNGNFRLERNMTILGTGDFNGDGQDDILVRTPAGWGFLTRNNTWGALTAIDKRTYGQAIGGWRLGSADYVAAIGDFDGDGRDEILVRSGWGWGLIGMPEGQTRFTAEWAAGHGTSITTWTMRASDTIGFPGRYRFRNRDAIVVQGDSGVAVVNFHPTTRRPYISNGYHKRVGERFGGWRVGSADRIEAAGDFDGDGYDSFLIRSNWGYGLVGKTGWALGLEWVRSYNCGRSSSIACHDGLLGGWLVRKTDEVATVLKDVRGNDVLVFRNHQPR